MGDFLIQKENVFYAFEQFAHYGQNHRKHDDKPRNTHERGYVVAIGFFEYLANNGNDYAYTRYFENQIDAHFSSLYLLVFVLYFKVPFIRAYTRLYAFIRAREIR